MLLTDHAAKNRVAWTGFSADYVDAGRKAWARDEPDWGIFGLPESEVGFFYDVPVRGRDSIELGCGTAYVSSWLHKMGAKPVGIDLTPAQLRTARTLQNEFEIHFPLVECSAEHVPFRDSSFDLAVSEYGASIWCDPYLWIPEVSRLLRTGGWLVFLRNSTLSALCTPMDGAASAHLHYGWKEIGRLEDESSVEFQIPPGEMIRLLRANDFEIVDLIELLAPPGATTRYDFMPVEWANKWPAEEVWKARKK